jgi:MFS transporter, ACS family, glucarate transporter
MTEPTRPTSIRWIILALTVCVAVLLYLDRYCLGFVLSYVRENYGLTEDQTRFLVSAFFYTYAFGQIPCGWLADRYGARLMLSLYLAIWSALTGLMGFAQGFITLLLFRFGCGLFEAGAYPACAGLIRRWIPYEKRGFASGVVSLGGRIGGTVAPLATAYLMVMFLPLDASSLVNETDILLPRKLARDTDSATDPDMKRSEDVKNVGPRLIARMTDQGKAAFLQVASLPSDSKPSEQQLAGIAQAVNHLLKQPDLLDGLDTSGIKRKLNRQGLQIYEKPISQRSEDEVIRLNRYLLEIVFPDSIRKLEGNSWQPVLMIYGAIGVLLAVVFWLFYRDTPREHFLTNEAEALLVESHKKEEVAPATPIGEVATAMLRSPGLWASAVVQFGINFVWIFLGNEMPTYLQRVYQVPVETRGWMTTLTFSVSLPMLLVGGWWTDWLTKRYGTYLGRAFPLASTRFVGAAALIACWYLDAPWPITIALCVFSMVSDLGLPAIWAYNLDVGGRNVGLILGWGNMIGNLGAAVSATVLGFILKNYVDLDATYTIDDLKQGYRAIFLTCAAIFVLIGIISFFVDATKPIGVNETKP